MEEFIDKNYNKECKQVFILKSDCEYPSELITNKKCYIFSLKFKCIAGNEDYYLDLIFKGKNENILK